MKVKFNPSIKIAGIGLVPWTRLGLEKWLPNYAIASEYGWDNAAPQPPVYALADYVGHPVELARQNTQNLLEQPDFQDMLAEKLPGYDLLTYKPVNPPAALQAHRFLSTKAKTVSSLENKAVIRQELAGQLNFPAYKIIDQPAGGEIDKIYQELSDQLGSVLIVQAADLSGGKGTFKASDVRTFKAAVSQIKSASIDPRLVVSAYVANGQDRSIQACVTSQAVFSGPLQSPIVAHPSLVHPQVGMQFTGAVIDARHQSPALLHQAEAYVQAVGSYLKALGYRGIFGLDLMIGPEGQLYTIEANVRITGVTPLLATFYKDGQVPFYLLHCLELGGYDYEIADSTVDLASYGDASLVIMHNRTDRSLNYGQTFPAGIYRLVDDELVYRAAPFAVDQLAQDEYFIVPYFEYAPVEPAGRMAMIYANQSVLTTDNDLDEKLKLTIEKIYKKL